MKNSDISDTNAPSEDVQARVDAYIHNQAQLDLLRFITCGSVDDGKSTLIGRMLFEAQLIFEDQITSLQSDSKKVGTQGGDIDFALPDGLPLSVSRDCRRRLPFFQCRSTCSCQTRPDTSNTRAYGPRIYCGCRDYLSDASRNIVEPNVTLLSHHCLEYSSGSAVNKMDFVDY